MLFGDSLMAGYGLTQNYHLDKVLQKKFQAQNIKFINASVSGDTTKGGLDRLDWSLNDRPDLVILGLRSAVAFKLISESPSASRLMLPLLTCTVTLAFAPTSIL